MARTRDRRRLIALAGAVGWLAGCGDNLDGSPRFAKQTLDTAFRAEGVAVFDVDRDGDADVVTDQYWYEGPDLAAAHELRAPETYDVNGYSKSVGAWGDDIDGDGWTDLVVAPFPTDPMYWYRNPQGAGPWTAFEVAPALAAGKESPIYVDLFGDGHRVLVAGVEPELVLAWFAPGPDPTAPWVQHAISAPGFGGAYHFSHGLGLGDVDGDGWNDLLTSDGWFQRTLLRPIWLFHPFTFGPDPCSTMFARDLDGDGRADLVCGHPHSYGLVWWQQAADGTFVARSIDDTISQLHAVGFADLDGDAVPEIVTGKNWLAHPSGDPGLADPAVLVYYTTRPDGAGGAAFERHDVDGDSGVGRTVTIDDVDGDGRPDIITTSKKGLFVFRQR